MKINLDELLKYPKVFKKSESNSDSLIKMICEYNNLKYLGTYVFNPYDSCEMIDDLLRVTIPFDVDDLLHNKGLIGYTDGEILLIGFTFGTRIFVKNPA